MKLIVLLFYLTSFSVHSQIISGVMVNGKTKEPLVYANVVLLLKNKGTTTGEKGGFTLNLKKEELKDSILFSFIGYKSKVIGIQDLLNNKSNIVKLVEEISELEEVVLSVKKAKYTSSKTIGFNKKGIQKSSSPFGHEYASLIKNTKYTEGRVKSVVFFLKENKSDLYDKYPAYFRIKFYKFNENQFLPGELLSYDDILIKPENKSKKINLDVSKYNIQIPENGIIVGIEVINPNITLPKNVMYTVSPYLMKTHTKEPMSWSRIYGRKWNKNTRKSVIRSKFYSSLFFNLEVEFKK